MPAVNLAQKLSTFSEHWAPRVVTTFNGHDVMVVKVKGEFRWHQHDDTDDLFLVLSGRIRILLGTTNNSPGPRFTSPSCEFFNTIGQKQTDSPMTLRSTGKSRRH